MAVESYLMFPYENLFQEIINHAGDFGDLVEKEMMIGDLLGSVTVPEFDFDEGDLFKAPFSAVFSNDDITSACGLGEEAAQEQYPDISNGSPKNCEASNSSFNPPSPQTLAATQRLNCLCIKSEKTREFPHLLDPEAVDSETCILIESPSSNENFSSVYPPTAVCYDPSPPELEQASLASHGKISLSNGLLSYASDDQTQDLGMGSFRSSADSAPTTSVITAQMSSPANSRLVSNGPIEEAGSRVEALLLEEKNGSSIQGSQLIHSTRLSSSMDHVDFVSKGDAAVDSLSPLPAYVHRTSIMLERSLSSHTLGQLMSVPRMNDSSLYPQISPIHGFPSPDTALNPQVSEFQEMNKRSAFTSMRRVYSTGDIQTMNDTQMGHGCGSPLTSSEHSSFEEAGFKVGRYSVEERKQRIHRYKKKRTERNFNKKIKYACRKTLADSRPRVRGRFARNDDLGDTSAKGNGGHADEDDEEEVDHVQEEDDDIVMGGKPASLLNRFNGMNPVKEKHSSSFGF